MFQIVDPLCGALCGSLAQQVRTLRPQPATSLFDLKRRVVENCAGTSWHHGTMAPWQPSSGLFARHCMTLRRAARVGRSGIGRSRRNAAAARSLGPRSRWPASHRWCSPVRESSLRKPNDQKSWHDASVLTAQGHCATALMC